MNPGVLRQMASEAAISDACEWLDIPRDAFFLMALAWEEIGAELWQRVPREAFYEAWVDDAGRSNLCANTIDQFSRQGLWHLVCHVLPQRDNWFYLDYGCGTAAISHCFAEHFRSAVFADVPNIIQEFVRWRVERHGYDHIAVIGVDDVALLPDESFDFIACVDVLEHLANPTPVFELLDRLLRLNGLLLHRSPWAREDEDLAEHLPEAVTDWRRPGGGQWQLAERYQAVAGIEFGGLYQKERGRGESA